jgi:SAM-dependent methyltransferase
MRRPHEERTLRSSTARFDRRYFDKWYRSPIHRVVTATEIRRRVMFTIGVAEHVLGRTVRSVLDVGCGEALWRSPLLRLRPGVRYDGVDPSAYVVERFGRTRHIRLGRLDRLAEVGLRGPYDLIVCADVLHFLPGRELERGLPQLRALLAGVAYLPVFTAADRITGDVRALRRRSARWYRDRFRNAGLVPIGLDCYVTRPLARTLSVMERGACDGGLSRDKDGAGSSMRRSLRESRGT